MDPDLVALLANYSLTGEPDTDLATLATLDRARLARLDADLRAEVDALHQAVKAGEGTDQSLDVMSAAADAVHVIAAEIARRDAHTRTGAEALAVSLRPAAPEPAGLPSMAALAARVPASHRPAPRIWPAPRVVTASGRALDSPDEIAAAMAEAWNEWSGERSGGNAAGVRFQRVVTIPAALERRLSPDDTGGNDAVIASARHELDALVASGGSCAPTEPYYAIIELGTNLRPIRDALPSFGADRGGIRYTKPPSLAAVSAGVDVWTNAIDENPGENTKNLFVASCRTVEEVLTQAITQRARFGNFGGRAYPEDVAATLALLGVAHARTAEAELLDAIAADSTAVTTTEVLGAARDLLHVFSQAAAAQRSRLRLGTTAPLQLLLPGWVREMIRADLAYSQPGDQTLSVSDEEINGYFASRHLQPAWYEDTASGAGQVFGAQGATDLRNWPDTVQWFLFPPGSFLFLDGGELNLGIVRDGTLNATNDFETFAETFEAVAFVGTESLTVTSTVCPTGESSAPNDDAALMCAAS